MKNKPDPADPGAPNEPGPARFPSPGTRRCQRCGALNGVDFDRCIRCTEPLAAAAAAGADAPATTAADAPAASAEPKPAARRWPPEPIGRLERPWAAKFLLGLTLLTFVGQLMAFYARESGVSIPLLSGLHEVDLMRFGSMPIDLDAVLREPWLLLSCVFVHVGVLHIGLNMMGFASLARISEPAIGPGRFLIAYVVSGLAGSVATIALYGFDATGVFGEIQRLLTARPRGAIFAQSTAGASGAVCGVAGLVLGWLLRRRDSRWKNFAFQVLLFGVVFGFAVNAAPGSTIRVNNAAHIGGLLTGILFGLVYAGGRRRAPSWLMNGGAALCVIACIGSLVLAQLSPRWRTLDGTLTSLPGEIAAPVSNRVIAPSVPTV
ncbi:MAG TPA: rhomboid family intramembrane serine protease [Polyangiaceae bacterium]|nr:rhomboid family intramembrane serine protease [Polyangiaceae bacterium]